MTEEQVTIHQTLSKVELSCIICYDQVQPPLLHCANAYHFICATCSDKTRRSSKLRKCAICKSAVFHNKLLEQHLKDQMYKCLNAGCNQYLFNWSIDEHRHECIFTSEDCPICKKPTSLGLLKLHLKQDCPSISWIRQSQRIKAKAKVKFKV